MREKEKYGKRGREKERKREKLEVRAMKESAFDTSLTQSMKGYQHTPRLSHSTYCACVLGTQELAVDLCEFIKRCAGNDGKDENKALSILHVEIPHGCELLGACCVENLEHALQPIHLDLFPIRVLDRWVVSVHKHRLYKLNGLVQCAREWCHAYDKKIKRRALERVGEQGYSCLLLIGVPWDTASVLDN